MSSPLALFEASDAHEDAQPESLATAATGTSAWLTVLALIVTTASIQVAVGVNAVLFPVVLLTAGYSNTLIGFCLAMEVLAVIIISRYIAQVIVTIGLGRVLLIATILRGASLYFIADSRDLAVWVIGVFLFGMGTSFMIIATMTWLNTIPVGRFKGAVMGAFSSALSLGTATGPVIANVVGFGGDGRALFRLHNYTLQLDQSKRLCTIASTAQQACALKPSDPLPLIPAWHLGVTCPKA